MLDDDAYAWFKEHGGLTRENGLRFRNMILSRGGTEDAEDLTQGFFALLLERKDLNSVRKEKGRLRSYLLTSLKHFLADKSRHAMAVKRGKGQRLIPLDDIREGEHTDINKTDRFTAEQIYERRWAFTVLEQVMARLREEYRSAGNVRFFDQMKKMLMDEPDKPSQAQVASEFDMTENAVKIIWTAAFTGAPNNHPSSRQIVAILAKGGVAK